MKKTFFSMASIACGVAILSSLTLSSTVEAQDQELPKNNYQGIPQAQAIPNLVALLTKAGFNVKLPPYPDTTIAQHIAAAASSTVSLDTLPLLTPYHGTFSHHVLMFTFTVDPSQRSFFLKEFGKFQEKFRADLSITQGSDGVFKTSKGWTTYELELFQNYFSALSLSKSIHIQTISAFFSLTAVEKATIFYANLQKSHPQDAQRIKELAELRLLLQQRGYKVDIIPTSMEMQASTGMPAHPNFRVKLKDVPDLSFYKDKLVFTFMFDRHHIPHVGHKLRDLYKKHPSLFPLPNGFKTMEGWTNTDLNNFKKEFDVFSSYIYVTEVSTSFITLASILNRAQSYGLGENWKTDIQPSGVVAMKNLMNVATKAM